MEMAIQRILTSAAILVWLLCGSASAQQPVPLPRQPIGGGLAQHGVTPGVAPAVPFQAGGQTQLATAQSNDQEDEAPELSSVGRCCAVCGGGSCCPPDWYVNEGVSVFHHSRPSSRRVSWYGPPDFGGVEATGTRGLSFDIAAGYTITVGRNLGRDTDNRDQFVEFCWDGMHTWKSTKTIHSSRADWIGLGLLSGNLYSGYPFDVGGFNRAEMHYFAYRSRLDSYELNAWIRPRGRSDRLVLHPNGRWRRECQPGWYNSYMFGMRVFCLQEDFTFLASGRITELDPRKDTVRVEGSHVTRTDNDMLGFQFGGDIIFRRCLWSWGFRYRIGPLLNFADMKTVATTTGAADGDPYVAEDLDLYRFAKNTDLAAFADIGVVGSYKIRPNVIVHVSWDWMWMIGLALAPENLEFDITKPAEVNDDGDLFFQGLTASLEWTW